MQEGRQLPESIAAIRESPLSGYRLVASSLITSPITGWGGGDEQADTDIRGKRIFPCVQFLMGGERVAARRKVGTVGAGYLGLSSEVSTLRP